MNVPIRSSMCRQYRCASDRRRGLSLHAGSGGYCALSWLLRALPKKPAGGEMSCPPHCCACNSPVAESVNTERILWYFLPVGMGRLNTTKVCLPVESKQVEQGFKTQRAHRRSHSRTRRCSLSRVLSWQSRRRGNLTNES